MKHSPEAHFEQAGRHLQEALSPVRDTLFLTLLIAGTLVIGTNALELTSRAMTQTAQVHEPLEAIGLGSVLVGVGGIGVLARWWTRAAKRT
jgi:hypothetical protein